MTSQSLNRSSSRWGSFLQQAVAGVESRLDTILADEDSKPISSLTNTSRYTPDTKTSSKDSATVLERSPSLGRRNDRLRERLAKAVDTRSGSRSPAQSSNTVASVSHSTSLRTTPLTQRHSVEDKKPQLVDNSRVSHEDGLQSSACSVDEKSVDASSHASSDANAVPIVHALPSAPARVSLEKATSSQDLKNKHSSEGERDPDQGISYSGSAPQTPCSDLPVPVTVALAKTDSQTLDHQYAGAQWQEEANAYMEHIDALEAKLRYLTEEATELSRKTASEAIDGSVEERVALKDETIALLMNEGQALLQNEFKLLTTIRQLRAKSLEDEKSMKQGKERIESLSKVAETALYRANRTELTECEQANRIKELLGTQREIKTLKSKFRDQESQIANLRQQLSMAKKPSNREDFRKQEEVLERERKRVLDLQDELSTVRIEKKLEDERQHARLRDLREKLDHEKDVTKRVKSELLIELGALESKMESYRTRAEEAASTETKDSQVKLLRQADVLQSQYATATQNWRGIESSLLSRIAILEKERDEVRRKENENRRRSREAGVKVRRLEEDLQQAVKATVEMEESLTKVKEKLANTETVLAATQKELDTTKISMKRKSTMTNHLGEQIDANEASYRKASPISPKAADYQTNANSSIQSLYSKPSVEKPNYRGHSQPAKPALSLGNSSTPQFDRSFSRQQSTQPSQMSGTPSPFRQDSLQYFTHQVLNSQYLETPSIQTEQFDELFDGTTTPLTPERTIHDVMSLSTTDAGPSVQLIERMSAAVRRLEAEKASTRDELERTATEREETRKQVILLMQEIEERKNVSERARTLEREVETINQRYQTTLEMLGEKSELVEELRADVADVKQMYKDLVERTLR